MLAARRRLVCTVYSGLRKLSRCAYVAQKATTFDEGGPAINVNLDEFRTHRVAEGVDQRLKVVNQVIDKHGQWQSAGVPIPNRYNRLIVYKMEKEFLDIIVDLRDKGDITITSTKELWSRFINEYQSQVFSAQTIADILCSFASQHSDQWLIECLIPQIPAAAEELNLLSVHILATCIAAYNKCSEGTDSIDRFLTTCYDRILKDYGPLESAVLVVDLRKYVELTLIRLTKSRWREVYLNSQRESKRNDIILHALPRALSDGDHDMFYELAKKVTIVASRGYEHMASVFAITCIDHFKPAHYGIMLKGLGLMDTTLHTDVAAVLLGKWLAYGRSNGIQRMGAYSLIDAGGKCTVCGEALETDVLTDDDMHALKSCFYDSMFKGDELWVTHNNPQTVRRFLDEVKNAGPYDLVVDGLNYFYTAVNQRANSDLEWRIRDELEFLNSLTNSSNGKCLIVVRSHFKRSLPRSLDRHHIVALPNSTVDDRLVIYAALDSGSGCYLLSSDNYKQHSKFLMAANMRLGFHRWQRLRQLPRPRDIMDPRVFLKLDSKLRSPLQTKLRIQRNGDHWHVPISGPECPPLYQSRFPMHDKWLCLKHI